MTTASARRGVVLPFRNEAHRLRLDEMDELLQAGLEVYCVDDGSTDGTTTLLQEWSSAAGASLLVLDHNRGKGEAIRHGLNTAVARGCDLVGYADGDFSTSASEIIRLEETLRVRPDVDVVLGARVQLAGRAISREAQRHYLGRIIATILSLRSGLAVYDTQCGAKWFHVSGPLRAALQEPFATRWFFDVELLRRMQLAGEDLRMREEPLEAWSDIAGGHMRPKEYSRILKELGWLEYERLAPSGRARRARGPRQGRP